jgi:uncharacterized Tic20 family protein
VFDRTLDTLFLRLYAKNLSRSSRGEPENACTDSEIQLSTMLLVLIGAVILIAGSLFFPAYLLKLVHGGNWAVTFLITLTLGVTYWVHRRFGGYKRTPELAGAYRTRENHRWSVIAFWSTLIGWLLVMVVALGHMRS